MKIIFFGSSNFSVMVLNELVENGLNPSLVVTTPDSEKGRGQKSSPNDVKEWATNRDIPFVQPNTLAEITKTLENTKSDFFIIAAYGKIIPEEILKLPKYGALCVHPSLLPRWRGSSPVQATILAGDKLAGVSIIELDKKVDHGPILAQKEFRLTEKETASELNTLLWPEGGKLLTKILKDPQDSLRNKKEQDHAQATFSKKIEKPEGLIDSQLITKGGNSIEVTLAERKVRALNPDPGVYTIFKTSTKDIRVKILEAKIENDKFVPVFVVPEGKRKMSWEEFLRGNKI
ncbi:MAG: methionyl-tRNA formyltransferase [Candidatus Paceibacterota bacterium]|jgi:methionyl-tRNA formyltransferase